MTKEEIIANNKLIAEFYLSEYIDEQIVPYSYMHQINLYKHRSFIKMKYHSSWNWLMPIVRKIIELCLDEDDELNSNERDWTLFESDEYTSVLMTIQNAIIKDSYKVVVEFIKFYNDNK
jgi:hypothetical protein